MRSRPATEDFYGDFLSDFGPRVLGSVTEALRLEVSGRLTVNNKQILHAYNITTDEKMNVEYEYRFEDNFITTDVEFEKFIHLKRNVSVGPSRLSSQRNEYLTPFGLQVVQLLHNHSRIFAPFVFKERIEGLCGDYDGYNGNDWRLRNGTVCMGTYYMNHDTKNEFRFWSS